MRLGTCIAVEIFVGAGLISAACAGTAWGVARLRAEPDPQATVARATVPAAEPAPPRSRSPSAPPPAAIAADAGVVVAIVADAGAARTAPEDVAHAPEHPHADIAPAPDEDPPPPGSPAWHRGGHSDDEALQPLRDGAVAKVKFNHGGMTLSLRIDFDNGARAAFKPDQTNAQSNPRKEIAAYRIDRLLGLDRVPPSFGRTFTVDEIEGAVQGADRAGLDRLRDEAIAHDGELRGELSWWIPVIADGYVDGYRIDTTDGVVTWRRYLQAGATIPAKDLLLCQQISEMLVFDFLVDNIDRWSGNNAKTSSDGRVLYFMDNTMSFGTKKKGHSKNQTYLNRVHTFSKKLIAALRAMTEDDVRAAIADDLGPFDHLLTSAEISAMLARRDYILKYVDDLIEAHGEDEVLAFP